MDFTDIIKAMETMTDAQIASIQKSANGIMKMRDNERKVKAIQNFKEAFSALCEANVWVYIECDEGTFYINNAEQFDFF